MEANGGTHTQSRANPETLRFSIRMGDETICIGKTAPPSIVSTEVSSTGYIGAGLLGTVIAFVWGWSHWVTTALVLWGRSVLSTESGLW